MLVLYPIVSSQIHVPPVHTFAHSTTIAKRDNIYIIIILIANCKSKPQRKKAKLLRVCASIRLEGATASYHFYMIYEGSFYHG